MALEPFTIRSGAAALAAVRHAGDRPPAVLLHAGVADRRSWRPAAGPLSRALRLVAYDRRGFGDTTYAAEPHRHADDLLCVLDAVAGDEPAWLIGSSQGGRVAIDLTLARPDRVAGLVLVSPAITGAPEPELTAAEAEFEARFDAAEAAGDRDAVNRLDAHLWLDGPAQPEGRVAGAARELFLDMNGRALSAPDPGPELEPPDAWARLDQIACPALVVWGDLDLAAITAGCAGLAAILPAGRPAEMAGTAHLPYLEQPARFAALAAEFLGSAA